MDEDSGVDTLDDDSEWANPFNEQPYTSSIITNDSFKARQKKIHFTGIITLTINICLLIMPFNKGQYWVLLLA
jgi:hypothetical protein